MHNIKSLPSVLIPALILGLLLFGCAPEESRRQVETPPAAVTTPAPEQSPAPPGPPDPPPTEPAPSEPSPAGSGDGTEQGATSEATTDDEEAEVVMPDQEVMDEADVVITLDNEASQAWLVSSVEGGQSVAETGEENPTLTLEVGQRYVFLNPQSGLHPLAFRDQEGNVLVTQEGGGQSATFALDQQVDQVVDGDALAFTLTPELAAAMSAYICTVHHVSMVGNVEVTEQ